MDRRLFLKYISAVAATLCTPLSLFGGTGRGAQIALTFDDPHHRQTPLLDPIQRNMRILDALDSHDNLKAALFVSGSNVDSRRGALILKSWDNRGHIIGNHSYSHLYLNSPEIEADRYAADILRCEEILDGYKQFRRIFRYPYLKAGDTEAERDAIYDFLRKQGYKIGHVTIDTSDWYIDQRLCERLKAEPETDTAPYRDYYVNHILDRVGYYTAMAGDVLEQKIPHTLLLHHNLINALFLPDMFQALTSHGHTLIDAESAFAHSVYDTMPQTMPAGESLVYALAMNHPKYRGTLRYPTESAKYEEAAMDSLGL